MRAFSIFTVPLLLLTGCSSGEPVGTDDADSERNSATATPSEAASPSTEATTGEAGPTEEAQQALDASSAKLEWFEPGPAFQIDDSLAGSKTLFVTVQLGTPFSQHVLEGIEAGIATVGATVTAADSGGNPTEAARQIAQGVSQGVSAIFIQGFPSAALSAEIESATEAGVPVVMLFDEPDTGEPSAEQESIGVVGNVDMCWSCAGQLLANAAYVQHGEETHSVFISAKELASVVKQEKAYVEELGRLCPDCVTKVTHVPVAQWATGIQGAVSTALSDPNVNVVAPVYDFMIPAAQAAMSASQTGDGVDLISADATIVGISAMAEDASNVAFLAGAPPQWAGWLAVDQWLRHESGLEPAADSIIPMRGLTAETIQNEAFDLEAGKDDISWFTDVDLESEFKSLWGL